MLTFLVFFYRVDWRLALFFFALLAVYIMWQRYKTDHDNWLTRLVRWFEYHEETITNICIVFTLVIVVAATFILFTLKN